MSVAAAVGLVVAHQLRECEIPEWEAARQLGISRGTLMRTFSGERPMKLEELCRVASLVDVSIVVLMQQAERVLEVLGEPNP